MNLIDFDSNNVSINKPHQTLDSGDETMPHQTVTISDNEGYFYDNYDISAKQCKLCPMYFKSEKNLERHINNIHSADKNYVSWINNGVKRKNSDNYSERFKKIQYDYNTEKPEFLCKLCDMLFTNKISFDRHKKNIHDTDKNYVSWIKQGQKRKIDKVSSSEKSSTSSIKKFSKYFHRCKLCSNTFSRENALIRHIKNIHSADEKYNSTLPKGQKRKTTA